MEKLKAGAEKLGLHLNTGQIELFETYYQELIDWNRRVNLTSITGYEEVQVAHFLDSLTLTLAMAPVPGGETLSVIDVGSGAGLPGIPLRIAFPSIRLSLLEATAKKARFLEHLATSLRLDNIEVVVGRAEEAAHDSRYRERFDLVLSRAVAPLAALAELTLPLAAVGGAVMAQKKGDINAELNGALKAISVLGGGLREIKTVDLPEFPDRRCLVVIGKVNPSPPQYPRRPGMPARRPLH